MINFQLSEKGTFELCHTGEWRAVPAQPCRPEAQPKDLLVPSKSGSFAPLRMTTGLLALMRLVLLLAPMALKAQEARIRDLTVEDKAVPVRLMGYGLVVGLDNSGDRVSGIKSGGMTVTSVVNLLRRFNIEVPADVVRMRNVAAVLVTAEVSPYLRPGGKFDVSIASVGDARSLRGGVLWTTPLLSDVGGTSMASAQGPILTSNGSSGNSFMRASYSNENAARIPTGGLLESDLPRPKFDDAARLVLREPDVSTATSIAMSINRELGDGTAKVEDPGAIALTLKPDAKTDRAALFSRIQDLKVRVSRVARIVIDSRDGTIVTGGEIAVGEAVVSHGGFTVSVGLVEAVDSNAVAAPAAAGAAAAPRDSTQADSTAKPAATRAPRAGPLVPGDVRIPTGTSATRIAAALHALKASSYDIAAIFEGLRSSGAISAEVIVR